MNQTRVSDITVWILLICAPVVEILRIRLLEIVVVGILVYFLPGYLVLTTLKADFNFAMRFALAPALSAVLSAFFTLLEGPLFRNDFLMDLITLILLCAVLMILKRRNHSLGASEVEVKSLVWLAVPITMSIIVNSFLLIFYRYPIGYDVWSYIANAELIAEKGVIPMYFTGAFGVLGFYPPMFGMLTAFNAALIGTSPFQLFLYLPLLFAPIFTLSMFALSTKLGFNRGGAFVTALFAGTLGSEYEGMNRAFPIALGMIVIPLVLILSFDYFQRRQKVDAFLAVISISFIWLEFPIFAIPIVFAITAYAAIKGIQLHSVRPLLQLVTVLMVSSVAPILFWSPYLVEFGLPHITTLLPADFFTSSGYSLKSYLAGYLYISPTIPLVAFFLLRSKFKRDEEIFILIVSALAFSFTLPIPLPLFSSFISPDRYIPLVGLLFCVLCGAATNILSKSSHASSRLELGLLLFLLVGSNFELSIYGNYRDAPLAMTRPLYNAIKWIGENTPPGSIILTLDYVSSAITAIANSGRTALFDQDLAYGFWINSQTITAYQATIAMFTSSNESYRLSLFAAYNISYVLITNNTALYLSEDTGLSIGTVNQLLRKNFYNDSNFTIVYPSIPSLYLLYDSQVAQAWKSLAMASNVEELETAWGKLPDWMRTIFRTWLAYNGYQFDRITWNQTLAAIHSLPRPPIQMVNPSILVSYNTPLPVIYRLNQG